MGPYVQILTSFLIQRKILLYQML